MEFQHVVQNTTQPQSQAASKPAKKEMNPLVVGLICIGIGLGLKSFTAPSPYPTIDSLSPATTITTTGNYLIHGSPEHVATVKHAMELVDYFDQDIYGQDVPAPSQVFAVAGLYSSQGDKLNGVMHVLDESIEVEVNRSIRDIAGTLFHERLHIAGLDHNTIYPLQDQFVSYLAQQGY